MLNMRTIRLPERDVFTTDEFITAICKATHRQHEDAKGIDCIIGAQIDPETTKNLTIVNNEWQTIKDGTSLIPTLDDKAALTRILPSLPPLRAKMSSEEKDKFIAAYKKHPNRLPYLIPIFITEGDINSNHFSMQLCRMIQANQINEDIKKGNVNIFYIGGQTARSIDQNTCISRSDALKFINRIGFHLEDEGRASNKKPTKPSNKDKPNESHLLKNLITCIANEIDINDDHIKIIKKILESKSTLENQNFLVVNGALFYAKNDGNKRSGKRITTDSLRRAIKRFKS